MRRMLPVVVCLGTLLASCSTQTVRPAYEYRIEYQVMATGKDDDDAVKRLAEELSRLGRDGWVLPEGMFFHTESEADGSVTMKIWKAPNGFLMRRRK